MVRSNDLRASTLSSTSNPDQARKRRKLSNSRWTSTMEHADGDNTIKARIAGPAACPNCATHSGSFGASFQPLTLEQAPNFSFSSYLADDEEDDEDGGVRLDQEDAQTPSATAATVSSSVTDVVQSTSTDSQHATTARVTSLHAERNESQYFRLPFPVVPDFRGTSTPRALDSSAPNFPLFLADNFDNHSFEPLSTVSDEGDPTDDTLVFRPPGELTPSAFFPSGPELGPMFEGSTDGPFTVYTFLAEDALPVDDPLRNYDFSEFIRNWHLRSGLDKSLPEYGPSLEPDLELLKTTDVIRGYRQRQDSLDIQGIRWQDLGLSRADAVAARSILHPSNLNLA